MGWWRVKGRKGRGGEKINGIGEVKKRRQIQMRHKRKRKRRRRKVLEWLK